MGDETRDPAGERELSESGATAAAAPSVSADVRAAADGDTRAFERLYRRYVPKVHGMVRRMMGAEYADDVTQEVFLRVWDRLETFRGDAAFSTWLHRVAVNVILTRREQVARRRKRYLRVEDETIRAEPSRRRATPGLSVDFEEAIEALPDGAREIFVLYDVQGYKHREIAEMLDISVGTSKSQLHRARMLLREHLA